MNGHAVTYDDLRKPMHGFAKEGEEWRVAAQMFEELARTCVFCSFTAKHRGALKRHMVRRHIEP